MYMYACTCMHVHTVHVPRHADAHDVLSILGIVCPERGVRVGAAFMGCTPIAAPPHHDPSQGSLIYGVQPVL